MGTFLRMLGYKCNREGSHFVAVDPRGTSTDRSNCGVEADKPLWVRDHPCASCGFEADHDLNAAYNILSRSIRKRGVDHSEPMLGRLRSLREPIRFLQSASLNQEAPLEDAAQRLSRAG